LLNETGSDDDDIRSGRRLLNETSSDDNDISPKFNVLSPEGEKSKLEYKLLLIEIRARQVTY